MNVQDRVTYADVNLRNYHGVVTHVVEPCWVWVQWSNLPTPVKEWRPNILVEEN